MSENNYGRSTALEHPHKEVELFVPSSTSTVATTFYTDGTCALHYNGGDSNMWWTVEGDCVRSIRDIARPTELTYFCDYIVEAFKHHLAVKILLT